VLKIWRDLQFRKRLGSTNQVNRRAFSQKEPTRASVIKHE